MGHWIKSAPGTESGEPYNESSLELSFCKTEALPAPQCLTKRVTNKDGNRGEGGGAGGRTVALGTVEQSTKRTQRSSNPSP